MPHGTTSGSRWRRVAVGFGPAAILVFAAACSDDTADATGGEGLEDGLGGRADNRDVHFLTYYNPTADAFWNQMLTGANDAALLDYLVQLKGEGISSLLVTHNLREDTSVEELTAAVVEGAEGVRRHRQGSPIA